MVTDVTVFNMAAIATNVTTHILDTRFSSVTKTPYVYMDVTLTSVQ